MNLRQTLSMSPRLSQLTQQECDLEIDPRPGASFKLEFLIDNDGMLHPAVTLESRDRDQLVTVVFGNGFTIEDDPLGQFLQKARQAEVWFVKEDPRDAHVHLIAFFGEAYCEQEVSEETLAPFMRFLHTINPDAELDELTDAA